MPDSIAQDGHQRLASAGVDSSPRGWYRLWLGLAGIAALVSTSVDAVLLQRKHNLFTGGFLSVDYLKSPLVGATFFITSLIADLGITAPLSATALWIAARIRLNAKPSVVAVVVATVSPILVWTFFSYRLQVYLGQAFDRALTYEISGQSVPEIMAVVTEHLAAPLLMLAGGGVFIITTIWLFKRVCAVWRGLPEAPGVSSLLLRVGAISLLAMVTTCVAWISSDPLQNGLRAKLSGGLFSSIGESVTDFDRDGYGLLRRPLDPAPLDPEVYPFAVEIPGNDIDENGVAGDLPVGGTPHGSAAAASADWAFSPNVIFVLLESFRADLIGAAYNGKAVTPALNRVANEGVSSPHAFSHNGFTAPSRYNLFTGNPAGSPGSSSLIDDFRNNGYEVAYFSAQDVEFGGEHFDIGYTRADVTYDAQVEPERRFTTFATRGSIGLPYQVILEKVSEFLAGRRNDRPLFLYVNFQDTHFPYYHRRVSELVSSAALPRADIGPDRAADLWATYVNTAANVDLAVGQVLATARRFLQDPNPGIIITSDHGESLYDDGFLGHGIVLNDVQTQVPLIVANLPITIEQPFGLVDLRGALRKAMHAEPTVGMKPTLRVNPLRRVFQHLGNFYRPRQIALTGLSGRTIYDFRTDRFRLPGGEWRRPGGLSGAEAEAFRSLVHQWERLVLVAAAARSSKS